MADVFKTVVNCETGEENQVKLSKSELDDIKVAQKEAQAIDQLLEELKQTKISAYKKLGLTDEEINSII